MQKRILSLWFPRLGAERLIRAEPHLASLPLASVAEDGSAQRVASVSVRAAQAGIYVGQLLRDAHALCAELVTRATDPRKEAAFLHVLHRWAGKFSPWVSAQPPDSLVLDLTGCAHLFGGEAALCDQITQDCADLGITVQLGLADTLGTAWALARYAHAPAQTHRSGDAIDQEARATRSRAGKRRHWERGGTAPAIGTPPARQSCIAPPGQSWFSLSPLPIAALRIDAETTEQLNRLGLRHVGDLLGQPRASLARRFGRGLVDRLDQATGSAPEPISPAAPPDRFAMRMSFPDPIGLEDDVAEGFERLLTPLCRQLRAKGRGARALRLEAHLCDHTMQWQTVLTAVPSHDPNRIIPLIRLKLPLLEAGPGIDMLRLETVLHEPLHRRRQSGHLAANAQAKTRLGSAAALEDLIGRLGARIGMEAITRRHPGDSHVPEKEAQTLAAAWSKPAPRWPKGPLRPVLLWPAEALGAPDAPTLPRQFRWRGRDWTTLRAIGPERLTPEWWFDDPAWRTGARDYWRVITDHGDALWIFYAHGAALSAGWFCHGSFA
ncbi:DUF6504 family protein [Tropicibacter naphthalenivorans]|uniref:DNA polymerase IV n=1 Tax=Tropicibacter naphthalenivorans TaxID=441103 RepID=A0A0P1GTW7_9RHOB|nr:DUF6504 family protein [Tropicibacter naphthalenivorans]CUH79067.1 DNA polymerase IV [Tropicibacter naphthalenivorans]SMD03668.1 protein ImuB [Tropicibacter naphthalenivorans]